MAVPAARAQTKGIYLELHVYAYQVIFNLGFLCAELATQAV